MPKASVKRSINCKKEQLVDLVLDIEKYPEFVPFCVGAKVYEKKENSIFVTNLDGPLKHLKNTWLFKEENNVTEISFEVDFELKNEFLNIVMTKSFQFALDKIAEAFQKRAEDLFKKV